VDLAPLELVQQIVDRHRFGDEQRCAQDGPELRAGPGGVAQVGQEVLSVQDADHRVDRLLVDGDPAVALLDDRLDRLVHRRRRCQ
jgi:hypothetical protein